MHGFVQHVTNRSETEILIIGADCSVASQPLANLAPFWNLVQVIKRHGDIWEHVNYTYTHNHNHAFQWHVFMQVSTTSTSPRLSNQKNFPTFLRPVASDTSIAPGIVKLMQYFEWKHVAIITQEEDIFTLVNSSRIMYTDYCTSC